MSVYYAICQKRSHPGVPLLADAGRLRRFDISGVDRDFILDLERERGGHFGDPEICYFSKMFKTPRVLEAGSVPRVQSLGGGESKR